MKTTVVNINRHTYEVYIGRPKPGRDGYYGNPFTIEESGGRLRAIDLYRDYFYKRIKSDQHFAAMIEKLRGKCLGCFCYPEACHGDVIADYLNNPPKIVVCGSRKWLKIDIIEKRLSKLPPNAIIIQGGCGGADLLTRRIALDLGLESVEFPAAWKKFGKAAGPIRNIKMLNCNPSLVIAFHDDIDKSKGTKHTVSEARSRGIKVEIIDRKGRLYV